MIIFERLTFKMRIRLLHRLFCFCSPLKQICRKTIKTSSKRSRLAFGLALLTIGSFLFWILRYDLYYFGYRSVHWITYGTRPLWDSSEWKFERIAFKTNANLNFSSSEICEKFGWKKRTSPVRVFDAVIFSIELGMTFWKFFFVIWTALFYKLGNYFQKLDSNLCFG